MVVLAHGDDSDSDYDYDGGGGGAFSCGRDSLPDGRRGYDVLSAF